MCVCEGAQKRATGTRMRADWSGFEGVSGQIMCWCVLFPFRCPCFWFIVLVVRMHNLQTDLSLYTDLRSMLRSKKPKCGANRFLS